MKDANGLEIGPEKPCLICGEPASTRPDGSVRAHSRWKAEGVPRLGVESCPGGHKPSTTCPECGVEDSVTWRREEEKFPYGAPVGYGAIYGVEPEIVELTAIVDMGRCAVCKFEFTDWRAEIARDAAVQVHLNGAAK